MLRGLPFPARDTTKWIFKPYPDLYDPRLALESSYAATGSLPDEKAVAGMDSILGWRALVPADPDAEFVVTWHSMPNPTGPPHLAVRAHLGPATPADSVPGLTATFLNRLRAVGLPYALEVHRGDDDPSLVESSFR